MNQSGPDVADIQCRVPDGCCGPSPCAITKDQFICQIRSLLPAGDLYNTTLPTDAPETENIVISSTTVGCLTVGQEQRVFGGCCEELSLPCDDTAVAPQLALVDAFAAVGYDAVRALCEMLRELDPCTADRTLRDWARRFGMIGDDLCDPQWSDHVLAILICVVSEIKLRVINWDYLQRLAARFGAQVVMHAAGDFNCGPIGWWTMARDRDECPETVTCPPGQLTNENAGGWIRLTPTCEGTPESLNLVLCPADIQLPNNCNNPPPLTTLPHDPELYQAFKWLLPKILPTDVFWCVYECDPENCIV